MKSGQEKIYIYFLSMLTLIGPLKVLYRQVFHVAKSDKQIPLCQLTP